MEFIKGEALRRPALHCGPQAVEGIGLHFGCVALLAAAVGCDDEEVVAVSPARHGGVACSREPVSSTSTKHRSTVAPWALWTVVAYPWVRWPSPAYPNGITYR